MTRQYLLQQVSNAKLTHPRVAVAEFIQAFCPNLNTIFIPQKHYYDVIRNINSAAIHRAKATDLHTELVAIAASFITEGGQA
jgi:hypothetical protein